MQNYEIWLDRPTQTVHAAVKNHGGPIREKDGVFTIRLLDEHRQPLAQHECKLPTSQHLGECYVYVTATPAGGLISTGPISATKPFQGVEIRYEGVFTDRPLTPTQLGPIFCCAPAEGESGRVDRTVTRLLRPVSAKNGDRK